MEWGSSVPEQFSVQELVAAKEKAGVTVVGLCTPAGLCFINTSMYSCSLYTKLAI